jgi:hypothetical protein
MFGFTHTTTRVASLIAAAMLLIHSTTPANALEISETNPPQAIWEIVPDMDEQAKVFLDGAGSNGSKWQGGFLVSSRDGKPVTFRLQIGEGKHRVEYDNRRTEYVSWVSTCTEGPAKRLSLDPRARDAELRYIECDHPNQFELVTHQIWHFPPGTYPR